MNELSIIITIPSTISWQDYKKELNAVLSGKQVMNFKVSQFPKLVKPGDKCYIVHKGFIKGWMQITGFSEEPFTCTTTGESYIGKFIQRSGVFHYLDEELPMKGFQGFRYFNLENYKAELKNQE